MSPISTEIFQQFLPSLNIIIDTENCLQIKCVDSKINKINVKSGVFIVSLF